MLLRGAWPWTQLNIMMNINVLETLSRCSSKWRSRAKPGSNLLFPVTTAWTMRNCCAVTDCMWWCWRVKEELSEETSEDFTLLSLSANHSPSSKTSTTWVRVTSSQSQSTGYTFHQRQSSLNQVQMRPWPRFSRNFCCTNAVQIKSRVKFGLTLNRRGRRIKLWSSVQLALSSSPHTVIPAISVQIGDNRNKVHLRRHIASSFRLSITE